MHLRYLRERFEIVLERNSGANIDQMGGSYNYMVSNIDHMRMIYEADKSSCI